MLNSVNQNKQHARKHTAVLQVILVFKSLAKVLVFTSLAKVLVFKFLAIPKTVHLPLTTTVPHAIINLLNNIKKIYMERKKSKNKTFNSFKQLRGRWFERRWRIYKSY